MTDPTPPRAGLPDLTGSGEYLVPDVLEPELSLVLVGTAPSQISARAQAYYANPENKFWRTLFEVGLTPRQLAPREYATLPRYGLGLTDVAKRHSGVDAALPTDAWRPAELLTKLEHYRPRIAAFTSKRGASETLGIPTGKLPYGPQERRPLGWPEETELWVLPSTSPLGHTHFRLEPWQALADRVRALQASSETGPREAGAGAPAE